MPLYFRWIEQISVILFHFTTYCGQIVGIYIHIYVYTYKYICLHTSKFYLQQIKIDKQRNCWIYSSIPVCIHRVQCPKTFHNNMDCLTYNASQYSSAHSALQWKLNWTPITGNRGKFGSSVRNC